MSETLIRDGVVYYERVFVDDLKTQLKAKEDECESLKEWLKDEIAHASASSSRCDFNNATRRYWSAKTEAFECVLLRMEADK